MPGVPILMSDGSPGVDRFVAGWDSVRGAETYVIQVSYDKGFKRILSNWDRVGY